MADRAGAFSPARAASKPGRVNPPETRAPTFRKFRRDNPSQYRPPPPITVHMRRPRESGQDVADDGALYVRQAEIPAAVAVGQPLVVDAEQVQDGGVQVVDVDPVLDRVHPDLVGR